MKHEPSHDNPGNIIVTAIAIINVLILRNAYTSPEHNYWPLVFTVPLLLFAVFDANRHKWQRTPTTKKIKTPEVTTHQLLN